VSSTFTDLSEDHEALAAALRRMGVAEAGATIVVRPLTGGVSSNVLAIEVDGRRFCLKQALPQLKVAKLWMAPIERVYGEIDWLETVAAIEPTMVPKIHGVDRPTGSFAMDFLDPTDHPNWKARLLAGDVDPEVAARVGAGLGRIHRETARRRELWATFATDDNFDALRIDPYLGEIARVHPERAAIIEAVIETTRSTKLALVHGDVSPKNILLGPQGPVLLDAECAWWGDPAFDLAFCANHLLLKAVKLPAQADALLLSFRRLVEAHLAAVDWEPAEALEARAAALLSCLLLARVDGKSPAEYLADPERDVVRRIALRLIDARPTRLATLAAEFERNARP
jgi:aminoglycoside phosphotransferase (APT) family kinase protein